MKIEKVFVVAMAFTAAFALMGVTIAKADLQFEAMNDTWWKTLKQMDKGYVVLHPAVEDSTEKAKKAKAKLKVGYMYAPPGCFDDDTDTYVGVLGIDSDGAGGWIVMPYDLIIMGGTPVDLVTHTEMDIEGARMALTVRATLTEDKKTPGTIKSGQVKTLGSFIMFDLLPDKGFFGNRDFRAKFTPEDKVPDDVIEAKDNFLNP